MTVFTDGSETTQTEQTSDHLTTGTQPQDSFVKKIVETKGQQWGDPEVLAKGKLEADNYIKNLEDQLAELKGELDKQDYSKTLLEQLRGRATEATTVNRGESNSEGSHANGSTTTGDNTSQPVSEDTLQSLVEKTLTDRERNATLKQNITTVNSELEKRFGTEAPKKVQEKATQLGVSIDRLRELASESPSAFFTLIGEKPPAPQSSGQGSIRTESLHEKPSGERDWSYYQNIRKTNKALYYSASTQQQMYADKARMGERFGNT